MGDHDPEAGSKRAKPDEPRAEVDEKVETAPWHTVVVSNLGDRRPEEAVPNAAVTFCLNQGRSVTNYVLVPDFGPAPIFLANFCELFDKTTDAAGNEIDHASKGKLRQRYVKKMIPNTTYLRDIRCQFMILFCHGTERHKDRTLPSCLSFQETESVWPDGHKIGLVHTPAIVWACSSYTKDGTTYRKPHDGITLSEVAKDSNLVLLLACCGPMILEEFASEAGGAKPDLALFWRADGAHDVSCNIALAMLMTAIELSPKNLRFAHWRWDEIVRRNICEVLLQIQECGTADGLFEWLWEAEILTPSQRPEEKRSFRIKGCINTYQATTHPKTRARDEDLFFEELQSLSLMIWHDDAVFGGSAIGRGYRRIHVGSSKKQLRALIDSSLPFSQYRDVQARPATAPAGGSRVPLDALLEQLRGLCAHAGGASI
jgi:hypothetical protein